MAGVKESHSEMALARKTDGISVVFDRSSSESTHCCSRSRSSDGNSRSVSYRHRGRSSHKRRNRSPSTTSSTSSSRSRSSSQPRSRSHPRCHRPSSRCRCDRHRRHGYRRYRHSAPRRCRDHSKSYSRSPSPSRFTRRRHYRSRSRSYSQQDRHKRTESPSPSRTNRSRSKSRSAERSVKISLEGKRELLKTARANAMTMLGMEKVELPDSVKAILPEPLESNWEYLEPETRVRQSPERTLSQSPESERDDMPSLRMSPKRKMITFSVNNSVAKPTVVAPCAKVTARVDIYDSRQPYGQWVVVKSSRASNKRKQSLTMVR
ncbi:arginine/serine-rich protein 1 [Antennarius striatus]|uniref:arginine/serine-rich protein 1 n=1 Tax=Antennarius striatus TaxID=241820 RepID=UPI0035B2C059